jgi:hypothetical protein
MVTQGPLLALAAFAAASIAASAASAAAPAYCALYSREYAIDTVQPQAAAGMLQSVQDQAYYRCLNQDDDPPLPQQSAYFGSDLNLANPGASSASNAQSLPPPLPTPRPAVVPSKAPVVEASTTSTATAGYRPSGLTPWTPEWQDWCQRNFPNSWDPKTGTVLHYGDGTRELCQ